MTSHIYNLSNGVTLYSLSSISGKNIADLNDARQTNVPLSTCKCLFNSYELCAV
uniref:Uncharacterized protein n=1 Tax=Anguilla anguilla TaxID=7936 RepID=A0A0E9VX04_ANGAN